MDDLKGIEHAGFSGKCREAAGMLSNGVLDFIYIYTVTGILGKMNCWCYHDAPFRNSTRTRVPPNSAEVSITASP